MSENKNLLDIEDNNEVYTLLKSIPSAPKNIILPQCLSSVLFQDSNVELINIIDFPDQIYGKAIHGEKVKLSFKNGNTYEGDVLNGMLHGRGSFLWTSGVRYTGSFLFNRLTGNGSYSWPDGSTYTGEVLDSLRHGQGVFTQKGVTYEGGWNNGLREGQGVLKHPSGTVYEGGFLKGMKHGKGRVSYANGNCYEGEWIEDKKNGAGMMFWKNSGERYVGEWRENQQNGYGTHMLLEERGEGRFLRNRYQGYWKHGYREGFGVFFYANGSKYEGEWAQGLKQGFARFTDETGEVGYCQFIADKNPQQQAAIAERNAESMIGIDNSRIDTLGEARDETVMGDKSMMMEIMEEDGRKEEKSPELKPQPKKSQFMEGSNYANKQLMEGSKSDNKGSKSVNKQFMDGSDSAQMRPSRMEANKNELSMAKSPRNGESESKNVGAGGDSPAKQGGESPSKSPKKSRRKKETTADAKPVNKVLVEANPFCKLIDLCGLFPNISEALMGVIMKSTTNMLLRHNPLLKRIYKFYAGGRGDSNDSDIMETHFSMDYQKLWKMVREIRVLTPRVSLAALNRLCLQAKKAVFPIEYPPEQLQTTLGMLKGYENMRGMPDEDLIVADFLMKEKERIPETMGLHSSERILLYRQFVDCLVRLAYLRSEDPLQELHRSLERIITAKINPIFELKKRKTKDSSQLNVSQKGASRSWEEIMPDVRKAFDAQVAKRQNGGMGVPRDDTVLVKSLLDMLVRSGFIASEDDKWLAIQLVEKVYDPEETLSGLLNETTNNTSSDKASKRKEKELQGVKSRRMALLVENELLFEEFSEVLRAFLMRKKEHHVKTEAELISYLRKSLSHIIKSLSQAAGRNLRENRVWPESRKDQARKELLIKKEEKKKQDLERLRQEEQARKEQYERGMMFLEDKDVAGEKGLEEMEKEQESLEGGESEASYF